MVQEMDLYPRVLCGKHQRKCSGSQSYPDCLWVVLWTLYSSYVWIGEYILQPNVKQTYEQSGSGGNIGNYESPGYVLYQIILQVEAATKFVCV